MQRIKNIIFDIGNVLIPLRFDRINESFSKIMADGLKPEQMANDARPVFHDYETGALTTPEFINGLKPYFRKDVKGEEIAEAWKTIIGDFPKAHVELLKKLSSQYRLFILSNTNEIHVNKFEKEVPGVNNLRDLFEKTYYSHIEQLRKPQLQLYQRILDENKLVPCETLFADDLPENLEPAKELGIRTLHVTPDINLNKWFDDELTRW